MTEHTPSRGPVVVESATPISSEFRVQNGDVIDMIVAKLLIVDDVAGPHSNGFGDVDLFAIDVLEPPQTPGTMLNSPWGMIEVLPVDHARSLSVAARFRSAGNELRRSEPSALESHNEDEDFGPD